MRTVFDHGITEFSDLGCQVDGSSQILPLVGSSRRFSPQIDMASTGGFGLYLREHQTWFLVQSLGQGLRAGHGPDSPSWPVRHGPCTPPRVPLYTTLGTPALHHPGYTLLVRPGHAGGYTMPGTGTKVCYGLQMGTA